MCSVCSYSSHPAFPPLTLLSATLTPSFFIPSVNAAGSHTVQAASWVRGPQTGASSPICVHVKGTANSGGDVREGFPGRQLFAGTGHVGAPLGKAAGVWAAEAEAKRTERGRQDTQARMPREGPTERGWPFILGCPGATGDL